MEVSPELSAYLARKTSSYLENKRWFDAAVATVATVSGPEAQGLPEFNRFIGALVTNEIQPVSIRFILDESERERFEIGFCNMVDAEDRFYVDLFDSNRVSVRNTDGTAELGNFYCNLEHIWSGKPSRFDLPLINCEGGEAAILYRCPDLLKLDTASMIERERAPMDVMNHRLFRFAEAIENHFSDVVLSKSTAIESVVDGIKSLSDRGIFAASDLTESELPEAVRATEVSPAIARKIQSHLDSLAPNEQNNPLISEQSTPSNYLDLLIADYFLANTEHLTVAKISFVSDVDGAPRKDVEIDLHDEKGVLDLLRLEISVDARGPDYMPIELTCKIGKSMFKVPIDFLSTDEKEQLRYSFPVNTSPLDLYINWNKDDPLKLLKIHKPYRNLQRRYIEEQATKVIFNGDDRRFVEQFIDTCYDTSAWPNHKINSNLRYVLMENIDVFFDDINLNDYCSVVKLSDALVGGVDYSPERATKVVHFLNNKFGADYLKQLLNNIDEALQVEEVERSNFSGILLPLQSFVLSQQLHDISQAHEVVMEDSLTKHTENLVAVTNSL